MVQQVSYVMPVLNEADHVAAAVRSVLAQDYAGEVEVVIALGPSTDNTDAVVAALCAEDPRVRSVPNPAGSTPAGLNAAIRASRYPIVVRIDAHSELPPNYTTVAVETIERTGAVNVGGVMDAQGRTNFEKAVALAYTSPVGLGGTRHHTGGEAGPAETVYLGVFHRERLLQIGLFDEELRRGQDWELNRRINRAGGLVWFTPELRVTYRPRSGLGPLLRQFLHTGRWRGELFRREPAGLRYLVPPIALLGLVVGTLLGVVGLVALAAGATGLLPALLLAGFAAPALYLLFVLLAAAVVAGPAGPGVLGWFLIVLPCIHLAWGAGFWLGLFRGASQEHRGR
jgi:succinoglycan biosynthesis protein ExoA